MAYKVYIPRNVSQSGVNYLLERGYKIKQGDESGTNPTEQDMIRDVVDCDAF